MIFLAGDKAKSIYSLHFESLRNRPHGEQPLKITDLQDRLSRIFKIFFRNPINLCALYTSGEHVRFFLAQHIELKNNHIT